MVEPVPEQIVSLEARIAAEPDSADLREDVLSAYVGARLANSPGYCRHVLWYVRNHPRRAFASCPLAGIDAEAAPAEYAEVLQAWMEQIEAHPSDPRIVRGLAAFVYGAEPGRAVGLLKRFQEQHPEDPDVWVDLGRMSPEPGDRLASFSRARAAGSTHPNLLVWIARSAVESADVETADEVGRELLAVAQDRHGEIGDVAEWQETGAELWKRARASAADDGEAGRLVRALAEYAFHQHWGHTVLGWVAVYTRDIVSAEQHLHEAARIRAEHRLRSYGPSFDLAAALLRAGRTESVLDYLESCKRFWDASILDGLADQIRRGEIPDFDV